MDEEMNNDIEINTDMEDLYEDETEVLEEEQATSEKLKKLRQKNTECEKEKLAVMEELQRAKADFLNAKKRLEEERLRDKDRSILNYIEDLLPLCDSFEFALADKQFADAPDNLQKGIRGIQSQLLSILKSYNVQTLGEAGEDFNPNEYEAVGNIEVDDKKLDHKVAEVIQKGYKRNNDLIRPARVTVNIFTN